MVNKSNYRKAKELINNICAIEDCITNLDRDSKAKSSIIEIKIDFTDGKNGWPSKYSIPIDKKDDFF